MPRQLLIKAGEWKGRKKLAAECSRRYRNRNGKNTAAVEHNKQKCRLFRMRKKAVGVGRHENGGDFYYVKAVRVSPEFIRVTYADEIMEASRLNGSIVEQPNANLDAGLAEELDNNGAVPILRRYDWT